MNRPPPMPPSTRHLVAPELLPALDAFPSFDINLETIAELRAGGIRRDGMIPPLSPAQQAVHCEQRFVPGPRAAPDVRVLIYRPQGPEANARPTYLQDDTFDGGRHVGAMAKRLRRQHTDEIAKPDWIAPNCECGQQPADQHAERDREAGHWGAATAHPMMVINPAPPVLGRSVRRLESHDRSAHRNRA